MSYLPLTNTGEADVSKIAEIASDNTALVVICHASNVSGVITDVSKAASVCRQRNIPLLLDAAQTVGIVDIECEKWGAAVAFAGHKGLLGPQGTGAIYLPTGFNPKPLKSGGTGSNSESLTQPDLLPDRYESGTANLPALAGLLAAVRFIVRTGQDKILEHERWLATRLIEGLMNIKGVKVVCHDNINRTGVISFVIEGMDTSQTAEILDLEYKIATRAGLHCAPLAHICYGTIKTGTVRLSSGWFNTKKDIDKVLSAVSSLSTKGA